MKREQMLYIKKCESMAGFEEVHQDGLDLTVGGVQVWRVSMLEKEDG